MQRAVVPDMPHHDRRHLPLGSRQEDRSAGYAGDRSLHDLRHEGIDGHDRILKPGGNRGGSEVPDEHDAVNERSQNERHVSTLRHLREVRHEECCVDKHEDAGDRPRRNEAPPPNLAHGDEQERRGHQHRRRDSDAVGGCEIVGLAEAHCKPKCHEHQQPIDRTHIDLAVAFG